VKHMRVVEEEVSLSQPKTIVVPSEEEEVPVLPEEGEVPSPPPPVMVPPEEEVPQGPPVTVPPKGRECLVSVSPLVRSSPFFFSQKRRRFFSPFFS
jgi:hypothetical protein